MSGLTDRVLSLFLCFCKVQDSSKCDTDGHLIIKFSGILRLPFSLTHGALLHALRMARAPLLCSWTNYTKQMLSYKKHVYM